MSKIVSASSSLNKIIIVAALGYFVDIYDLVLFSVERKDSLTELLGNAATPENLKSIGMSLLNWQMGGMLLGGIFWGILGDKKGRLSVLFGSILMYSLANIANGFVTSIPMYSALRFISGFGLAGELGAGITLVSETMSKERRSIGTMIVATVGVFGAVVAGFMGDVITNWRWSFYLGGAMGLVLLVLRIGILESGMFESLRKTEIRKGNFLDLFKSRKRAGQYFSVIMIAVPVWYVMGILITFAPEIFVSMGVTNFKPDAGKSIMYSYLGITLGDIASGLLSHFLKSRKKALAAFMIMTFLSIILYFRYAIISEVYYYGIVTVIGFATGYWAVFMSTAAELFGTNIRATATTTAPNFVRGSVIFLSFLFRLFEGQFHKADGKPDSQMAAIAVGIVVAILSLFAWINLKETFHKDLNYTEE